MTTINHVELTQAQIMFLIPKNIHPSKEAFEKLGFVFETVEDDDLYLATLPKGWKLDSSDYYCVTLIDEQNRERASYHYETDMRQFSGETNLLERFCVHFDPHRSSSPVKISVKDRANGNILFDAGECNGNHTLTFEDLVNKAKSFLNEHYPDYENPFAYWD